MKIIKYWFYFSLLSIALWAFFDIKLWVESPESEFVIYMFHVLGLISGAFIFIAEKAYKDINEMYNPSYRNRGEDNA